MRALSAALLLLLLSACGRQYDVEGAEHSPHDPPRRQPAAGTATQLDPGLHHIPAWESARVKSKDPVAGVRALATRLLGAADADRFEFAMLPSPPAESATAGNLQGSSVFTLSRSRAGSKPLVSGNSGPALTTGFYHYLKYFANASVDGVRRVVTTPL